MSYKPQDFARQTTERLITSNELLRDENLEPCRICGGVLTPKGSTCPSCDLALEWDRFERECGR